jgi:uncharacterized protein YndB with AHSA1/START domain
MRVEAAASWAACDGKGIVRMEDRFDTDIDDLWSALTDPRRLARWLGEVAGDLHPGGEFHVEDLAAHLAGRERCDADTRWHELLSSYEELTSN